MAVIHRVHADAEQSVFCHFPPQIIWKIGQLIESRISGDMLSAKVLEVFFNTVFLRNAVFFNHVKVSNANG